MRLAGAVQSAACIAYRYAIQAYWARSSSKSGRSAVSGTRGFRGTSPAVHRAGLSRWATKGQQPPQNPNDLQRTRPRQNRSRTRPNALRRPPSLDYGTEGQRFESSRAHLEEPRLASPSSKALLSRPSRTAAAECSTQPSLRERGRRYRASTLKSTLRSLVEEDDGPRQAPWPVTSAVAPAGDSVS
jgi:hypothetical protein